MFWIRKHIPEQPESLIERKTTPGMAVKATSRPFPACGIKRYEIGSKMSLEQRTILIVDDNQAEIEMLKEAVDEVYPHFTLLAVMSGMDCLAVLRRSGQWKDAARPDLILLDLNMPAIDGRAVLAEIKSDPALRHIPVIILTTSRAEKDVLDSYRQYANSYVVKSLNYDDLRTMVQQILHYWLHIARIPAPC